MSKSSKKRTNPANNQNGATSNGGEQDPFAELILMLDAYLKKNAKDIISVLIPVSICLFMVVASKKTIDFYAIHGPTKRMYTPPVSEDETVEEKASIFTGYASTTFCVVVLLSIIPLSYILQFLFKYQRKLLIRGFLMLLFLITLVFGPVLYASELMEPFNLPCSTITVLFFVFNFSALGIMSIHWKVPLKLQQFYQIATAVLLSRYCLIKLPDWAIWAFLFLAPIWDCFNVLSSKGPLNKIVKTSEGLNDPTFSSMMYSTHASDPNVVSEEVEEDEKENDSDVPLYITEEMNLGFGDFLCYSVLMGKAASFNDWNTTIAVFIAILAGLCLTLMLHPFTRRQALPAMPIPTYCGLLFTFGTHCAITPFLNEIARQQLAY